MNFLLYNERDEQLINILIYEYGQPCMSLYQWTYRREVHHHEIVEIAIKYNCRFIVKNSNKKSHMPCINLESCKFNCNFFGPCQGNIEQLSCLCNVCIDFFEKQKILCQMIDTKNLGYSHLKTNIRNTPF